LVPNNKFDPETCRAIQSILARVGDKWSVLIVSMLEGGPMRFNELRRAVDGISQRMLTLVLRGLERDGLVLRTIYPTIPPKVEYTLTEMGRTLTGPVTALSKWAYENRHTIETARRRFDRKSDAKPVEVPLSLAE
jgi:DNA-binding HxlR family transcriptional regulator